MLHLVDPVSALTTAGLFTAGFVAGLFTRRRKPSKDPVPVCSCGHALAMHDRSTSRCHAEVKRSRYSSIGDHTGYDYVPCTCQRYTDPEPITDLWTPPAIGE